jgi:hypothetical protein
MTKPERKKWAVKKVQEIWEQRKDETSLKESDKYKKKDDLSDCVLMCISFSVLSFVLKDKSYSLS